MDTFNRMTDEELVFACNNGGYCILISLIASTNDMAKLRYVVSLGLVDVKGHSNYALRRAGEHGNLEMMKYLCEEAGVDFLATDLNTHLALRLACIKGHIHIVKYLCEAGVDITLFNNQAVWYASLPVYRQFEIARYLITKGADITRISDECRNYIVFCEKMKPKIQDRAQKKIYFWWIPICYSLTHSSGCGKRMMQKNWEKTLELFAQ